MNIKYHICLISHIYINRGIIALLQRLRTGQSWSLPKSDFNVWLLSWETQLPYMATEAGLVRFPCDREDSYTSKWCPLQVEGKTVEFMKGRMMG